MKVVHTMNFVFRYIRDLLLAARNMSFFHKPTVWPYTSQPNKYFCNFAPVCVWFYIATIKLIRIQSIYMLCLNVFNKNIKMLNGNILHIFIVFVFENKLDKYNKVNAIMFNRLIKIRYD